MELLAAGAGGRGTTESAAGDATALDKFGIRRTCSEGNSDVRRRAALTSTATVECVRNGVDCDYFDPAIVLHPPELIARDL
jgi:hypothetical protein